MIRQHLREDHPCPGVLHQVTVREQQQWPDGRHLWARTIGSTIAGEAVDSMIFYPLAFLGTAGWTTRQVIAVMAANYFIKVAWEAAMTP